MKDEAKKALVAAEQNVAFRTTELMAAQANEIQVTDYLMKVLDDLTVTRSSQARAEYNKLQVEVTHARDSVNVANAELAAAEKVAMDARINFDRF